MLRFILAWFHVSLLISVSGGMNNGCRKSSPAEILEAPVNTQQPQSLKYLALGDSYTIGQNVSAEERFPYLLVQDLKKQNISIQELKYLATTGWTTINLMNAINNEPLQSNFDIVTLLIGVNDQYQRMDTGGYRVRFSQLLAKAIELAANRPSRVFVLSIPDYSATPFVAPEDKERVRRQIDAFNAINKEITVSKKVAYVNITPLTREAANDSSLLSNDELHYSAKEHRKWVDLLTPLVKAVL